MLLFLERANMVENKANVAGISIIASFALTLGKLVAGSAMGSASVLASGVHSGLDLLAAVLSYFSVNQAKRPADEDHRYGHGKYENVAAVAEALFIVLAVVFVIYRSVPGFEQQGSAIRYYDLGAAVTGVSALINVLVSFMLGSCYRRTMSRAMQADCRHLLVNAGTSAAVFLGIIAVKYTGMTVIDPFLAVLVALVLLKEGYGHLKKSAGGIFDARLSEDEERLIREVLTGHGGSYVQYHALRTRRSGPDLYVDLHLVVPREQVISSTHDLCDSIERDIRERLPDVNVLIHAEPCRPVSGECRSCGIDRTSGVDSVKPEGCASKWKDSPP